jgi:cytochrome c peroxidase
VPRGACARAALAIAVLATAGCDRRTHRPPQWVPAEHDVVVRPADELVDGKVLLGSPSLTAGISGSGPLTLPEAEAWLADPKNHEPLDFVLPIGLRELADEVKIPADNPLTRAKIELGRQLFVDRRLSSPERNLACFRCHLPNEGFTDHVVVGDPGRGLPERVPPMTINRIFGEEQFWDGRAPTLEAQTVIPIASAHELASTHADCLAFLQGNPVYRRQFEAIFGGVSIDNVGRALASFLRAIVTAPARFDDWQEWRRWEGRDPATLTAAERPQYEAAEKRARLRPMGPSAQRGYELFQGRAGCANCHTGPNFTDEQYHNLGVGLDAEKPDLGRYLVTKQPADRGAFRTPTLRNVAQAPGYMHNSQFYSLREVIDFFAAGGRPNDQLDPALEPFTLDDAERRDLLEFLASLRSKVPPVSLGRLPE